MKLELKFRYKAIKELLEINKIDISEIDILRTDFTKMGVVGWVGQKHAGGNLTLEQVEDMIDEDGTLIKHIIDEFSAQVMKYLLPNETSQSHLNA